MTLNILIAASGFEGSLSLREATNAVAVGLRRAMPDLEVAKIPLALGGKGFTSALVNASGGSLHPVSVTGPLGKPVRAFFGLLGGEGPTTAVIETAAAAGFELAEREACDPGRTTSYGVGELIRVALSAGAERILIGCGDTLSCDGGAGMAQALGVQLRDAEGQEIGFGAAELTRLAAIDLSKRDPRLDEVEIDVAVDWHAVLLGPRGVARSLPPQVAATPEQVSTLETALTAYAAKLKAATALEVASVGGGGVSGGLGAAAWALLGAKLHPHFDAIARYLPLVDSLEAADLVLAVEGPSESGPPDTRILSAVVRKAKLLNRPVVVLAAGQEESSGQAADYGADLLLHVAQHAQDSEGGQLSESKSLMLTAEEVVRLIRLGLEIGAVRTDLPNEEPLAPPKLSSNCC